MEFAILLTPTGVGHPTPGAIREHVRLLVELEEAGRLIAAGPFGNGAGGIVLADFANRAEAERFASRDPYVKGGFRAATIHAWEWSRRENGHLGVVEPRPDTAFLQRLRRRVTAMRFSRAPLPPDLLAALLEAAHRAPSEYNLQPWRAVVCDSAEARERLSRCTLQPAALDSCAAAVIVVGSTRALLDGAERATDDLIAAGRWSAVERDAHIAAIRSSFAEDARRRRNALLNAAIFAQQLVLAATSAGLASFWMGAFDEAALRAAFELPDEVEVAGIIGLGYPAASEPPTPRQPLAAVAFGGRYGEPLEKQNAPSA